MLLVETHSIKRNRKNKTLFDMIDEYCYLSKNLRNATNYIIKQCSRISYKLKQGESLEDWEETFIKQINEGIAAYNESRPTKKPIKQIDETNGYINDAYFLSWYLKDSVEYKAMPYSTCSQICIQGICKDWKAYYNGLRKYKTNPSNMLGVPRKPKYYDKVKGRNWLVLTSQNVKVTDGGILKFPKFLCDLYVKARHKDIRQVRIITRTNNIVVQLIYESENISLPITDKTKVMGIDLGLNNIATLTSNTGMSPLIINGKPLKSINHYYNKKKAELQSEAKKLHNVYETNRIRRLTARRNNKVKDYLHKISRKIIEIALENEIGLIVIGNNKGWKQEINLGKRTNQNFVAIPFAMLIQMIQYKAELVGITVEITEESYTSGTSYIDGERPIKENYNKKRRIHRGLFKSNKGIVINADVNAAYQIMKKQGVDVAYKGFEKVVRMNVA